MTTEFDIDALPFDRLKEQARHTDHRWKKLRIRTFNRTSAVGVYPEKMYDWRALESRAAQLDKRWTDYNDQLWAALKAHLVEAKHKKLKEVWVLDPDGSERVLVYDGYGYSTESVEHLVESGLNDPKRKGLKVSVEQARHIFRLKERSEVFRRRHWVYSAAFHHAVEVRLEDFVHKHLLTPLREMNYYAPAVFVLSSGGREYVVHSDNRSGFKWGDDKVFVSKRQDAQA